jgi:mRNA interferase RelE/StbE
MAEVNLVPSALADFESLPRVIQARVTNVVARLVNWPQVSCAKPLRGDVAGYFRIRTGDYRVQFRAEGDVVTVTKIGHRDGFYDE